MQAMSSVSTVGQSKPVLPMQPMAESKNEPVIDASNVDSFENLSAAGVVSDTCNQECKERRVFYYWCSPERAASFTKAGRLTFGNVKQFVENDMNFKGDGIYLAESPITSQLWGNSVVEVVIDKCLLDGNCLDPYGTSLFHRFAGVGRDWWVGKIDDILERRGLDTDNLPDPENATEGQVDVMEDVGLEFRTCTGSALSRSALDQLVEHSEHNSARHLFQELRDSRVYQWHENPLAGALTADEFTHAGEYVGPLESEYCTEAHRSTFLDFDNLSPERQAHFIANSKTMRAVGFDFDVPALANKNCLFRAWTCFYHLRERVKSLFRRN